MNNEEKWEEEFDKQFQGFMSIGTPVAERVKGGKMKIYTIRYDDHYEVTIGNKAPWDNKFGFRVPKWFADFLSKHNIANRNMGRSK